MVESKRVVECFSYEKCLANTPSAIYCNKLRLVSMSSCLKYFYFFISSYHHNLVGCFGGKFTKKCRDNVRNLCFLSTFRTFKRHFCIACVPLSFASIHCNLLIMSIKVRKVKGEWNVFSKLETQQFLVFPIC